MENDEIDGLNHFEVGVNVIAVPVEGVVFHAQVVAREIAGRVAQVVELIPQDPFGPRRSGHHFDFDGQMDGGASGFVLSFSRRRFHRQRHVTLRQSFPLGRFTRNTCSNFKTITFIGFTATLIT